MNTLSEFREGIHFLLGDDIDDPDHSDEACDRAVKQVLMMGLVPGFSVSGTTVSPDVAAPNDYMLVCAQAAYAFVRTEPDYVSQRTRPYAETTRASINLQNDLQDIIHKLQNGSMFFAGWQSLYTWLVGNSGVSPRQIGMMLTRLNVDVPIGTVTVAAGGITST